MNYAHQSWYVFFLIAFVINTSVLEAGLFHASWLQNSPPRIREALAAFVGSFFMRSLPGFTIFCFINFAVCRMGLPGSFRAFAIGYPISVLIGFWVTWFWSQTALGSTQKNR